MRQIIDRILRGEHDFTEETGSLSFSCEEILCETVPDRQVHGTFEIYAPDTAFGYVYSQELRVIIDTGEFSGPQTEIRYTVDSRGMTYGSVVSGTVQIVSDHGEYELPYRIVVAEDHAVSSMGELRNLFHFANLAKANWSEAAEFFYSNRFPEILSGSDSQYMTAYRGYSSVKGNMRNMENFLQVTHKKTRPSYQADVMSVDMELPPKNYSAHVRIVREGWGYTQLQVSSRGVFLSVAKEVLTDGDFSGNVATLSYTIRRDLLCVGENAGEIIISDQMQTIRIPVRVHVPTGHYRDEERHLLCRLMRMYLDYRTGRISRQQWITDCNKLLLPMIEKTPDRADLRLYQVQLLLTGKNTEEAGRLLDQVQEMTGEDMPELYAYGLYLRSLIEHDAEKTASYASQIRELLDADETNWRYAWMLLYMDGSYSHNEKKCLRLLKEQYEYGNVSPMLYLEGVRILTENVRLMERIDDYELALITFALRQGILSSELRRRFAFIAGQVGEYGREICELLRQCYELENETETVEAIAQVLMRGNCIGTEFFPWYALAVERELRLPKLYEYYIMSADLDYRDTLPKMVLMYFAYRSGLDTARLAFLYANVVRHQGEYCEIYEQYLPQIDSFAMDQLLRGRIDGNLAYLYRKLGYRRISEPAARDCYTDLLFSERIRVSSERFCNVIVVAEHLESEMVYPIRDHVAYIQNYSDMTTILLEDAEGNRYTDESLYSYESMLREKIEPERILKGSFYVGPILSLAEAAGDVPNVTAENAEAFAWLATQQELNMSYRLRLRMALIEFYFDEDRIQPLDDMLAMMKPQLLERHDRESCIRIMVARGLYDEAYRWIMECGIEGIDIKILVRLCDRLLAHNDMAYGQELVKVCWGILRQGKYDEETLQYLLKYGKGMLKDLKELWRAADSFGMDAGALVEQMMLQVLFTGAQMKEKTDIYLEHADRNMNTELEHAYLARLSYDYLVRQEEIPGTVFERVTFLDRIGEPVLTICILAWLKAVAERMEKEPADDMTVQRVLGFLARMRDEGIFLPFFTAFADLDPKCRMRAGLSFIEYRGHRDSRVILHYVFEQEEQERTEYRREEMVHVYGGIFVRAFLLFFGERIHYYITEEDGRQEKLTRSSILEYTQRQREEDRFGLINHIAVAHEMRDDITFQKLSEEYERKSYLADHLFLQDEGGI